MPSKEKSWRQLVDEADPEKDEPIPVYEFGGGKKVFTEKPNENPYDK